MRGVSPAQASSSGVAFVGGVLLAAGVSFRRAQTVIRCSFEFCGVSPLRHYYLLWSGQQVSGVTTIPMPWAAP